MSEDGSTIGQGSGEVGPFNMLGGFIGETQDGTFRCQTKDFWESYPEIHNPNTVWIRV